MLNLISADRARQIYKNNHPINYDRVNRILSDFNERIMNSTKSNETWVEISLHSGTTREDVNEINNILKNLGYSTLYDRHQNTISVHY